MADGNLTDRPRVLEEPGVYERGRDQLVQGGRGFYDGAFDGSTAIGAQKGNRATRVDPARPLTGPIPFVVRKGRR